MAVTPLSQSLARRLGVQREQTPAGPPPRLASSGFARSSPNSGTGGLHSPLPRHPPGLDDVDDPHLVGPPARIALHAQVLPGEQVRMLDGALLGDLDDLPTYLNVAIRVVGIEDRESDAGIATHVLVLHPPARRVDADVPSVEIEPDRRHLRAAVRHHGGEIGERLPRGDEIEELGRYRASCGDVLGRVATVRPRSVDAVMAEAGTAGSEESEQRDRKDGVTNHSAFACF